MKERKQNYERLIGFALDQGLSLFGVADVAGIREEFSLAGKLKEKLDWGISLGKRLLDAVLEDIEDRPTPLYFHHYRQLNFFLDRNIRYSKKRQPLIHSVSYQPLVVLLSLFHESPFYRRPQELSMRSHGVHPLTQTED